MTSEFIEQFQNWLDQYYIERSSDTNFISLIFESQKYSLQSGGKRFRPFLASKVFQLWDTNLKKIQNFCLAVEMIHTYSLIHDDLPCMDNDDYRRGILTNHKVYGEDIALLTGDSLLTEAFYLVAKSEQLSLAAQLNMIRLVAEKVGLFGMVGGQVLDMKVDDQIQIEDLTRIHLLKTGFLIEAAAVGAAIAAERPNDDIKIISEFATNFGLAFQVKDDLLDYKDKQQDFKSFVSLIGYENTVKELTRLSNKCISLLDKINVQNSAMLDLRNMIEENQNRKK